METLFYLTNFRAFGEPVSSLYLRPVTVLTGCNSSGKSSIVKALILLRKYLVEVGSGKDFTTDLRDVNLEFKTYPLNTLSRFNLLPTKNTGAESFRKNEDEKSKGGQYVRICNLTTLKQPFFDFMKFYSRWHCLENSRLNNDGAYGQEEWKEYADFSKSFLDASGYSRMKANSIRYYAYKLLFGEGIEFKEYESKDEKVLDKCREYDTNFYLPIFETLKGQTKEETLSLFQDFVSSYDNACGGYIEIENTQIVGFYDTLKMNLLSDESDTFIDYFKKQEQKYYNNIFVEENGINEYYGLITNGSYFEIFETSNAGLCCRPDFFLRGNNELSFSSLLLFLTMIDMTMKYDDSINFYNVGFDPINYCLTIDFKAHSLFAEYCEKVLKSITEPLFVAPFTYVSSSSVSVKKLYQLDGNDSFSNLLRRYFNAKRKFELEHGKVSELKGIFKEIGPSYTPNDFINSWIKKFGLGDHVTIVADNEGLGAHIRLYAKEDDSEGCYLTEVGYGVTQLISTLLEYEVEILEKDQWSQFDDRGHLVEPGQEHKKDSFIAIEEPEIHLHPKQQSLLADMMCEAYEKYTIYSIVETHSEYLVRRLQVLVAQEKFSANNISLCYVYSSSEARDDDDYKSEKGQIKTIEIGEDGKLKDKFGPGFYDVSSSLINTVIYPNRSDYE